MLNWDRIIENAHKAQGLSPEARAEFLSALETTTEHAGEVKTLLTRLNTGFLSTSADGHVERLEHVGAPDTRLGAWRLEALIGRGGMGEVWRARRDDGVYDQTVAVKLMQPGGPGRASRFDNERRKLAQMEHPGISRILDGGITKAGIAYMAMDFVDGAPIDQYTAGGPVAQKVQLLAAVCDAVHHAHTKLVLHRDLKPANILVDHNGQIRLIDFGIAAAMDEDESGGPLTLAYAAPEQLQNKPLTVATDVFALGLVLHSVLAGRLAARCSDASIKVDPAGIPSNDLIAIVERATQAEPSSRYPSADALARDLRLFLDGQPVFARRGGLAYRSSKFLKRYPVASALAAGFVLALAGGLGVSLKLAADARAETARTLEALDRAEWNQAELETINSITNVYSDALQRLSGRGMDVERVSVLLEEFLVEKSGNRAQDPESAALASFAIGRHFLSRNDYPRARAIFEPWLQQEYGSDRLRRFGWSLLGHAYSHTGDPGLAGEAFRSSYALTDTYGRERPGAASVLAQIAKHSLDTDDYARAVEALQRIVDTEESAARQISALNQIYQLRDTYGDDEGAHDAMREAVRLLDANPTMGMQGRDTNRLNFAELEFYLRGDIDSAARQVAVTRETEETAKGESREAARATELEGMIARARGDLETAEALLREAGELHLRFGGPQSSFLLRTQAALAMTLIDLGRAEEAANLLEGLGGESNGAANNPMLTIARAYTALETETAMAATFVFVENEFDLDRAGRSSVLRHYVRWFRERGVDL